MPSSLTVWMAFRYLRAHKGGFLAFLHFISIAGVAVGVMSLVVVISMMSGFAKIMQDKIIGTSPHLTLEKETGIEDGAALRKEILSLPGVKAVNAYVQGNVFLRTEDEAARKWLRGVDVDQPDYGVEVRKYLRKGRLEDLREAQTVVVGQALAEYYGFHIGDSVEVLSPGAGLKGRGWRYPLRIVGLFQTGMADVDESLLVTNLDTGRQILNFPDDRVMGVGVLLTRPEKADDVKKQLYQRLGPYYKIRSWKDANRNLFQAIALEKLGMFLVLSLMVLVAAFNIASTMVVTINNKVHDIGVLKSFGVSRGQILGVFLLMGAAIGLMGVLFGLVLGLAVGEGLRRYFPVPVTVYGIEHVPIIWQPGDILIIGITAFLICFLTSFYPAWRAASFAPVKALRYE